MIMLSRVKGNQPRLLAQLKTMSETQKPCERFVDTEKACGRITCRLVEVFNDLKGIDLDWVGVQSLVQVECLGLRSGKKYLMANYYISFLVSKATTFALEIRQHWVSENRLHWGGSALCGFPDLWQLPFKEVVFGEDAAPLSNYNAATNWSILRNIAINLAPIRWL